MCGTFIDPNYLSPREKLLLDNYTKMIMGKMWGIFWEEDKESIIFTGDDIEKIFDSPDFAAYKNYVTEMLGVRMEKLNDVFEKLNK